MEKENGPIMGRIHSIESFGSVDGPGVRFVIFLQGCRMRCKYCHNPETWSMTGGELHTAEEMFQKAYRYRNYWGKEGGITVSGGEPLLQMDFLTELFALAKNKGISTVVDTAGNPFIREERFLEKFNKLMAVTDLFMLDIKILDEEKHRNLTGQTNENILDMARYLSDQGKDLWLRHVLVPGYTDGEEDLKKLSQFAASLKTVKRFEVLPYHTLGLFKWNNLSLEYPLAGVPTPTGEEVARANEIFNTQAYQGYLKA